MQTLSVEEAAAVLHMDVRRVRGLARTGKLPAYRVGRRWLFRREQIEGLLGCPVSAAKPASLEVSARNRLRGQITRIRFDGLMAEVEMRIPEQELVSVITRSSAERLGLAAGADAFALIKSTEVMIGRETTES